MIIVEECCDKVTGKEKWLMCKYAITVTPKNNPNLKLKYCKIWRNVLLKDRQTGKYYYLCSSCDSFKPKDFTV